MQILKIDTEARRLGDFGEDEATKFLRREGYRILERNYVADGHEIDIIAENREYLIFVEVKSRNIDKANEREPRPASAVTTDKQRSIIRAAKCYIGFDKSGKKKRFDVIEVYVTDVGGKYKVSQIKHLVSTFNLNTATARR